MGKRIDNDDYKKILEHMPICCVDIIVRDGSKILLVLRKDKPAKGEWWPPGGRVHKHEKLEEAAKRKVLEETGLKVRIIKKVGVYETVFDDGPFHDLKSGVHSINICFLAELSEPEQKVKIDSTSEDIKWFDKIEDSLPNYVKEILNDARIF